MPPLVDTHVHLLAGLDDGPDTPDVAVAMCRMLAAEGAGHAAALGHQNPDYPDNTPDRIRASAAALAAELAARKVPVAVYPSAEVMASPSLVEDWSAGRLVSLGDTGKYLLAEMPHGEFVDLLPVAEQLRPRGVRIVVAHAERYPDLLHDPDRAARWIAAGCLIQVTARAVADPWSDDMDRGLRAWVEGGYAHLLGSDGHGIDRRQPLLAAGYARLAKLGGRRYAERVGHAWGLAVLKGEDVNPPPPGQPSRTWFTKLFGG
ncbi:MAG: protein tyrosine phosphatase [Gemmataceae bacterium]|nr:protein tyrosine phosphatase [Gemmataceae bacterium]